MAIFHTSDKQKTAGFEPTVGAAWRGQDDDGDHQQDVDEGTEIEDRPTEQPQDQQDEDDRPEHLWHLLLATAEHASTMPRAFARLGGRVAQARAIADPLSGWHGPETSHALEVAGVPPADALAGGPRKRSVTQPP